MEKAPIAERPKTTAKPQADKDKAKQSPFIKPKDAGVQPEQKMAIAPPVQPVNIIDDKKPEPEVTASEAEPKAADKPLVKEDNTPAQPDVAPVITTPAPAPSAAVADYIAGDTPEKSQPGAEDKKADEVTTDGPSAKNQDPESAATTPPEEKGKPADPEALEFMDPATTDAVLQAKLAATGTLAKETATTKSAQAKVNESVEAQNTPVTEAQSASNAGQVNRLAQKPVPPKKKDAAKKAVNNSIQRAVPKTLKDVDEFKETNKASIISRSLIDQVRADVGSVKADFNGIKSKPQPAPAAKGKPLPGAEPAKPVTRINLSHGILPAIKKEKLAATDYVDQVNADMAREGITQAQLDMVDSGDLMEAKLAKKQLETDAAAQPTEADEAVAQEHKALSASLNEAETTSRTQMANHRTQQLKQTGTQQVKAKSDLEKKRDEVAKTINDRYAACQQSITKKLNDLEQNSLASFDAGQKKATAEFEVQVDRDIRAFKDRRYSGALGAAKWLKDWWYGIDDFPQVKKAFADARETYVNKIDNLIDTITKKNNEVIDGCKAELETTRKEIDKYVKGLAPSLQAIGKKTQGEVAEKLKELGKQIEERKEKLQQQLIEKRKAAMIAIDKKIAGMKAKMKGAAAAVGKFLADAAKKFFKWALASLGIDAEGFMATLQKAGEAIGLIFKDPGKFFSNLIEAVKGSIDDFRANFKAYLAGGLFDWLTGALGSVINLPQVWDLKGIISVVLQVAGISWAFIRKKLVGIFGEEKIAYAEKTVDVVKKFVSEGVSGLWEWIKDQAETLKEMVVEGMKDWILTQMVIGFAEWIAGLLIPGGAIVKLIQGIYKLVMFFVDNMQRIMRWVTAVMDSLAAIASGAIGAAVTAIVNAMKTIIPVILDFFAKLLNIGGVVDAIQKIVAKIMAPIHNAIDKLIEFLKGLLNRALRKFKGGKAEDIETKGKAHPAEKDDVSTPSQTINSFDDINLPFTDKSGTESHHAYYRKGTNTLIIASDPKPIDEFFREKEEEYKQTKDINLKVNINSAKAYYNNTIKPLETELRKADLQDSDNSDAAIRRQKNAKDYEDNNRLHNNLKKSIRIFTKDYISLLVNVPVSQYPPAQLPVMADNVKAKDFMADYISDKVPNGSESRKHVGSLEGWAELKGRKIKDQKWVRMHLLPHKLGGDAVDSNLTPALGSLNTVFSFELEQQAINLAKKNPVQDRKVIWYRFQIKYYEGNVFPNYLLASFGTYERNGSTWKRSPAIDTKEERPGYPQFVFEPFNMLTCDWEPKELASVLNVSKTFAQIIKNNGGYGSFINLQLKLNSKIDLTDKLNKEYLEVIRRAAINNLIKFK